MANVRSRVCVFFFLLFVVLIFVVTADGLARTNADDDARIRMKIFTIKVWKLPPSQIGTSCPSRAARIESSRRKRIKKLMIINLSSLFNSFVNSYCFHRVYTGWKMMTASVAGITAKIIHDDKWHAARSTHSQTEKERERHGSEIEPDRNAQTAENCVCLSIDKKAIAFIY